MDTIRSHRSPRAARGFTILELVIVIGIVGLLYTIVAVSFRGMMPKYRLRAAAHELGTLIEQTRLAAIGRGLWMGIHYVLTPGPRDEPDKCYYQVIPPPPEDYPDQPVDQRECLTKQYPGDGLVRIRRIVLAGNQVVEGGTVNVLFSPLGNAGSHIVILEGDDGRVFSVKMNCITGVIDFFENVEVGFQHFQE